MAINECIMKNCIIAVLCLFSPLLLLWIFSNTVQLNLLHDKCMYLCICVLSNRAVTKDLVTALLESIAKVLMTTQYCSHSYSVPITSTWDGRLSLTLTLDLQVSKW